MSLRSENSQQVLHESLKSSALQWRVRKNESSQSFSRQCHAIAEGLSPKLTESISPKTFANVLPQGTPSSQSRWWGSEQDLGRESWNAWGNSGKKGAGYDFQKEAQPSAWSSGSSHWRDAKWWTDQSKGWQERRSGEAHNDMAKIIGWKDKKGQLENEFTATEQSTASGQKHVAVEELTSSKGARKRSSIADYVDDRELDALFRDAYSECSATNCSPKKKGRPKVSELESGPEKQPKHKEHPVKKKKGEPKVAKVAKNARKEGIEATKSSSSASLQSPIKKRPRRQDMAWLANKDAKKSSIKISTDVSNHRNEEIQPKKLKPVKVDKVQTAQANVLARNPVSLERIRSILGM